MWSVGLLVAIFVIACVDLLEIDHNVRGIKSRIVANSSRYFAKCVTKCFEDLLNVFV